jgi:hypothetical protein
VHRQHGGALGHLDRSRSCAKISIEWTYAGVVLVLVLATLTGCAGMPSPCLPIWLVVDQRRGGC